MPGIDYRAARASIQLAEVLELIAYPPRWRRGEVWRGPCPLHGSRSEERGEFLVGSTRGQPRGKGITFRST